MVRPLRNLGIERENATTKEASLSERLKELRDLSESTTDSSKTQQHASLSPESQAKDQPGGIREIKCSDSDSAALSGASLGDVSDAIKPHTTRPFDDGDDITLEELLDDLGADEQWLEGVATEFSAEEEHRKVMALLDEISQIPSDQDGDGQSREHESGAEESSDDDSNAETIQRESRNLIDQAMDEINYENENEAPNKEIPPAEEQEDASNSTSPVDLDLPSVPAETEHELPSSQTPQEPAETEADLASRMAALRDLGSSGPDLPTAPTSELDELGLPIAPSFAPSEHPIPGLRRRPGYTDDDEKSWCPVCLEDGTVRCFDCDSDVYCAKCWKDMHIGPRALYDFRGHRWEKFIKPR